MLGYKVICIIQIIFKSFIIINFSFFYKKLIIELYFYLDFFVFVINKQID